MMIRGVTKREDGFVFNGKYKKTKKYGLRPEFSSPEAFKKLKERCRKYKSIRSNYFKIKYYKIVNRFKLKTIKNGKK